MELSQALTRFIESHTVEPGFQSRVFEETILANQAAIVPPIRSQLSMEVPGGFVAVTLWLGLTNEHGVNGCEINVVEVIDSTDTRRAGVLGSGGKLQVVFEITGEELPPDTSILVKLKALGRA